MTEVVLRRAEERDLPAIAGVNAKVFIGDRDSPDSALEWARSLYKAFPVYQYFVVELAGEVVGYTAWQLHGGFLRAEPVVELDKLAIAREHDGKKLASDLTHYSMRSIADWVKKKNDRIESHITFVVWSYALNFNAIGVYVKDFTDGVRGLRLQFGDRAESMLRVRWPIIMPVRNPA